MSRERIKEIYEIIEADCGIPCHECKYRDKDGSDGTICIPLLAAERLYNAGYRKQTTTKPKEVSDNGMERWVCKCGNLMYKKQKYCDECGQKFNWED